MFLYRIKFLRKNIFLNHSGTQIRKCFEFGQNLSSRRWHSTRPQERFREKMVLAKPGICLRLLRILLKKDRIYDEKNTARLSIFISTCTNNHFEEQKWFPERYVFLITSPDLEREETWFLTKIFLLFFSMVSFAFPKHQSDFFWTFQFF